jgi:hypothetical protein
MSAAIRALFRAHEAAVRARTMLVRDGFPTDRVALTSADEPGHADLAPSAELPDRLTEHFGQVLSFENERERVQELAGEVQKGAAVVVVHPRGTIETDRALRILATAGATLTYKHDLEHQAMERAASRDSKPIVEQSLPESLKHWKR